MFLMTPCTPGKFNDYSKKKLQISTKKKLTSPEPESMNNPMTLLHTKKGMEDL